MPGYLLRRRLLPIAALLCVASCWDRQGYYRYQDAGPSGAAGSGSAGTTGGSAGPGAAGTGGSSAGTTGTGGTAGTVATAGRGGTGMAGSTAGRGGTTGTAGATGTAGRGGTTGTAGATGTAGTSGVLFSDDFETGTDGWNFAGVGTSMLVTDGSQVFNLAEMAGDQYVGAAGTLTWTNQVVEARVKVLAFTGTSSSDVAAICARLTDANHFYYFAIQSDGKGKIKIQNNGNSSIGSSIDFGFQMNTWYTMKLSVIGNTLTAYINGAMVGAPVTDSNLTAGAVGIMVQRTNAEFDDVVVRSAP
jgi:hypothetical protein